MPSCPSFDRNAPPRRRAAVVVAIALTLGLGAMGAARPARYTLEGTVRDREARAPVAGATVLLQPSRRTTTTEDDGSFSFGPFQIAGDATLVISHPDYRTVTIPLGALGTEAWQLDVTILRAAANVRSDSDDDNR